VLGPSGAGSAVIHSSGGSGGAINSTSHWKLLCVRCRDRLVATADFYMWLRNVRNGIARGNTEDLWKQCVALRMKMCLTRILDG
jgi:hypothetical protein